ncbi:MAG: heme biosynthesis HemY N-terminal domain-containing protein [Pseudomonadota bacterium]
MLWSLFKILLFVTITAALAYGAGILMETDGDIRIVAFGTEITVGPLQAVILALIALLIVWVVLKAIGLLFATLAWINGDETAISRFWNRRRERRGYEALADGMMALASGEGRLAMAKAAKAETFLRRPELTNLLAAQAAEMAGDTQKAQQVYKRLLTDNRTRFVGVRGIMKQKLSEGDTDTALKLAEKAFALKPRHQETGDILLQLQAGQHDWTGARKTLGTKLKHGALPRDVHRRRDAVLALSEAEDIIADGRSIESRERAIEANRLSPDLVPGAAMAARSYIAEGKPKNAQRLLKKAWEVSPHPDLAAAFAEIVPNETPAARLKRFQVLTRLKPSDPETKMLLTELNIAAEDFPAARRALGDLAESHPTARTLSLMAAIERGEGADDAVVRGWLAKAVTASRGPQWVCDVCESVHPKWIPVCTTCNSFDTLTWREPKREDVAMPAGADMMPLLAGAPEPAPEPEVAPEEPVVEATVEPAVADAEPDAGASPMDVPEPANASEEPSDTEGDTKPDEKKPQTA